MFSKRNMNLWLILVHLEVSIGVYFLLDKLFFKRSGAVDYMSYVQIVFIVPYYSIVVLWFAFIPFLLSYIILKDVFKWSWFKAYLIAFTLFHIMMMSTWLGIERITWQVLFLALLDYGITSFVIWLAFNKRLL